MRCSATSRTGSVSSRRPGVILRSERLIARMVPWFERGFWCPTSNDHGVRREEGDTT